MWFVTRGKLLSTTDYVLSEDFLWVDHLFFLIVLQGVQEYEKVANEVEQKTDSTISGKRSYYSIILFLLISFIVISISWYLTRDLWLKCAVIASVGDAELLSRNS